MVFLISSLRVAPRRDSDAEPAQPRRIGEFVIDSGSTIWYLNAELYAWVAETAEIFSATTFINNAERSFPAYKIWLYVDDKKWPVCACVRFDSDISCASPETMSGK